jgi:hypothetical protein
VHTVLPLLLASLVLGPSASAQRRAPPSGELQAAVDGAIAGGVKALLAGQDDEGGWRFGGQPRAGMTALALYALLQSDVPREHDAIRRGLEELARREPPGTYDASLMILALYAYDAHGMRVWIDELAQTLLVWQRRRAGPRNARRRTRTCREESRSCIRQATGGLRGAAAHPAGQLRNLPRLPRTHQPGTACRFAVGGAVHPMPAGRRLLP